MITDGKTDDYSLPSNTITTDNAVFNVFKFSKTTVTWPDNQAATVITIEERITQSKTWPDSLH